MKKFLKNFCIVFLTLALLSSKASAVPTFVDSFSVHAQEQRPNGLTFNNDGTKMFVTGHKTDDIEVYALTTGFDITVGSNYSLTNEIPDYGANIEVSSMF